MVSPLQNCSGMLELSEATLTPLNCSSPESLSAAGSASQCQYIQPGSGWDLQGNVERRHLSPAGHTSWDLGVGTPQKFYGPTPLPIQSHTPHNTLAWEWEAENEQIPLFCSLLGSFIRTERPISSSGPTS